MEEGLFEPLLLKGDKLLLPGFNTIITRAF